MISAAHTTFPSKAPTSAPFLHQALEVEEPADNAQTGGGTLPAEPEPQQVVEDRRPTAAAAPDSLSPAHQRVSAAEPQDNLDGLGPQHDSPNR